MMSENDSAVNPNSFKGGDDFFAQMIEAGIADDKFIREIVEMFLEEGNQSIERLKSAFEEKHYDTVKLYAHKLKSSFLMFDMHEAHAIVSELEKTDLTNTAYSFKKLGELESICKSFFVLLQQKYLC